MMFDPSPAVRVLATLAASCLSMLLLTNPASGQCGPQLRGGDGLLGPDGAVNAIHEWDPDGNGPLPPLVVLGGVFNRVNDHFVSRLIGYEPVSRQWVELGTPPPVSGSHCFATLPNGHLLVGGRFLTSQVGVTATLAEFDGVNWTVFGTSSTLQPAQVNQVVVLGNGDLVVAGLFTTLDNVPMNNIARWNGSSWSPLGLGVDREVHALYLDSNGDLYVGGRFFNAGGQSAGGFARWDGIAWHTVGQASLTPTYAITKLPTGEIVAGGYYYSSVLGSVASWNGVAWSAIGQGLWGGSVRALQPLPNGGLLAVGDFSGSGTTSLNRMAKWDGVAWLDYQGGISSGECRSATMTANGDVYLGGTFGQHSGAWLGNVVRVASGAWSPLGSGVFGFANDVAAIPGGGFVIGGKFTLAVGGVTHVNLVAFDGTNFVSLGTAPNDEVQAVTAMPNGDLVAAGKFTQIGGVAAARIARWNGTTWTPLGSGIPWTANYSPVRALAAMPNGDLIAGGSFLSLGGISANRVARWDGVAWQPMSTGLQSPVTQCFVECLHVLANGDLIAGGTFQLAGGVPVSNLARWDGVAWSDVGGGVSMPVSPLPQVFDLDELPSGELLVAGSFQQAGTLPVNYLAAWNGTTWSDVDGGTDWWVYSTTVCADGSLLVGGQFTAAGTGTPGAVSARRLARKVGSTWSEFGGGAGGVPLALEGLPDGEIVLVGSLVDVGNEPRRALARLDPGCPATAAPLGAPCAGGAGPIELRADRLPWIGGSYHATASTIPANALAFSVVGLSSPGTLLTALHPAGAPGCALLASPDAVVFTASSGGSVATGFSIPLDAAFVGVQLQHQVLEVELAAGLAVSRVSASNALALTIGSL